MRPRHGPGARHVLYVPGNHEFYGADIDHARGQLAQECARHGITLLDPGRDRHRRRPLHRGDTCGTDFLLDGLAREPGAHRAALLGISDFDGLITHHGGTERFTHIRIGPAPRRGARVHRGRARRCRARRRHRGGHHPPLADAALHRARGSVASALNPAFASDLEPLIARYQPALWIHGHMHNSVDAHPGCDPRAREPRGVRPPRRTPRYDPVVVRRGRDTGDHCAHGAASLTTQPRESSRGCGVSGRIENRDTEASLCVERQGLRVGKTTMTTGFPVSRA